ncbi:MAG TPA: DUF4394 domain-containing protein [Pyrinomonadaceae bacterium]|jgi:hypothetical protein
MFLSSGFIKNLFFGKARICLLFALFFVLQAQSTAFGYTPVIYAYDETTNRLISFKADAPGVLLSNIALANQPGDTISALDFRPATGELYGLRINIIFPSDATQQIIKINPQTGGVTTVGNTFSIANSGWWFGFNFSPLVDRIREVSGAKVNVRLNPTTGGIAVSDNDLAYAAGDSHVGQNPGVEHVAYANDVVGTATTTAYGIDVFYNTLVTLGSPNGTPTNANSGQLYTVGPLGITANSIGGIDIQPGSNTAYALFPGGGNTKFYTINLSTGAATLVGNVGTGSDSIHGPAISPVNPNSPADFDGDRKTDFSIFRPASGEWWYLKSSNGSNAAFQFGNSSDKLVPADYTGDGKTDVAIFRPSTGEWFILRSENQSYYSFPFGTNGDAPAPGDYDGDGKADAAVFRSSNSTWYVSKSTGGNLIQQFGQAGDVPAVGDYDGDGKSDIAIFRPSNGQWWYQRSFDLDVNAFQFGSSTDKPVQGDYTGDGKTDVAIFRPSNGNWFVMRSEDQSFYSFPFGASGDIPAPGDYDGDGMFDATVFRPSNNTWYSQRTTAGTLIQAFGIAGDKPVASAFIP